MNLAELEAEWEKDAGYVKAKRKLEPWLALADSLLAARMRANMTLDDLSRVSEYGKRYLLYIEAGLANPALNELSDIADALDAKLVIRFEPNEKTGAPEV